MSTYGIMQARIADELARSDLTSQIKLAILSAITNYQRQRFYFNESVSLTFSTVNGQEYYTSSDLGAIPNIPLIDDLQVAISSSWRYSLVRRSWMWIDQAQINPALTGQPTDYVDYAQRLRLNPTPNAVYTMYLTGVSRLSPDPLSADADTNAWMTDGEELIRQRAKADLFCNVIRDPDAQAQQAALALRGEEFLSTLEKAAYQALRGETTQRTTSYGVTAYSF